MKTLLSCLAACLATLPILASTGINGVTVSQDDGTRLVTVSYTLSCDEDVIVTLNLKTNNVALPGTALVNIDGDADRIMSAGQGVAKSATWLPSGTEIDRVIALGGLSAELTIWATNAPPPYLVVDLIATNVVRFYDSEVRLPGGLANRAYRTEKLLLRYIPAKNVIWRMGAEGDESGFGKSSTDYYRAEIPHYVKLAEDYYLGVFLLTQGQAILAIGQSSLLAKDLTAIGSGWEGVPMNNVSWNTLRGTTYAWPGDLHQVAADSSIGIMRAITGLEIDMPTEAQWEYACRAGLGTQLNNGKTADAANAVEIAFTRDNAYQIANEVGQLKPNGFGLYDMHGLVREWCLDWYATDSAYLATFGVGFDTSTDVLADPKGPTTAASSKVNRGGSWLHYIKTLGRCAARAATGPSSSGNSVGFRACCPVKF